MITIVGVGAMATLFAARLGQISPVRMLGTWTDAVSTIDNLGLIYDTATERVAVRVDATTDPTRLIGTQYALVLVKSWQTARAIKQIETFLAPDGVAVTLQNGLGNYESLAKALGDKRAAIGVTTQGATLLGPGHVREGGRGVIHFGEHPRLEPLAKLLRAANFDVTMETRQTLQPLMWGKLVVNAAINPLTALLRVINGELLNRPSARTLMEAAANEVAAVAKANGVTLPFPDAARRAFEVAQATAANRSSMLQDVLRGAPTEIEAINGAVVREAKAVGAPAPVNETLYHLVQALENELSMTR